MSRRRPNEDNGISWWSCFCAPGPVTFLVLLPLVTAALLVVFLVPGPPIQRTFTDTTTGTTVTTTGTTTTGTTTTVTTTVTTTTGTTTTTAAPTTSPGIFNLTCDPVVYSDVDILDGIPAFYTMTGTGCNSSTVIVSASTTAPSTYAKKNKNQLHQRNIVSVSSSMTTSVGMPATGVMPVCYNATELFTQFNVTLPTLAKRDLFTYPTAAVKGDGSNLGILYGSYYIDPTQEMIIANAASYNYTVYAAVIGQGLYSFGTINPPSSMGAFIQSIFGGYPNCITGTTPMNPFSFRFDEEAQRFVLFSLNGATNKICAAISDTENPGGAWTVYDFASDPNYTYGTQGFEVAIWTDYYHLCNGIQCYTFERDPMLIAQPTNVFIMNRTSLFPTPVFPYNLPIVHPTHQDRGGPRTSFMTTDAPCGVFSTIEASTGRLEVRLCVSINFTSAVATYNSFSLPVTGGWDNYVGKPCDCAILNNGAIHNPVYSDHVHSAYDKAGHLAWAWQSGGGSTSNVGIAWTELNEFDLLAGPVAIDREIVYPSSPTTDYYFLPAITYDCWSTLWLHMSHGTSTSSTTQLVTTYKLASDPALTMRFPAVALAPSDYYTNTQNVTGFPQTFTVDYTGASPRSLWAYVPVETGELGVTMHLERQTHQVLYVAHDACGTMVNCSQTIELFTNTSCLSA